MGQRQHPRQIQPRVDKARDMLGYDAELRWRRSWIARSDSDLSLTDTDHASMAAPLTGHQPDREHYFDLIISVLIDGGVNVILESSGT